MRCRRRLGLVARVQRICGASVGIVSSDRLGSLVWASDGFVGVGCGLGFASLYGAVRGVSGHFGWVGGLGGVGGLGWVWGR